MPDSNPEIEHIAPKLFRQRSGAYILDLMIAGIGATLLLTLISFATSTSLPVPTFNRCGPAPQSALTQEVDRLWPLLPGQQRISTLCTFSPLLGSPANIFVTGVRQTQGITTTSRTLTVRLDDNGNVAPYVALLEALRQSSLSIAIFLVFVGIDIVRRTRTTGRRLFRLTVIDASGGLPPPARILQRDVLRLLPHIVYAGMLFVTSLAMPWGTMSFPQIVDYARDPLISVGMITFIYSFVMVFWLVWWFWPFIRWTGQTYYDRITGCHVVRDQG
jgi:hypothetical protein